MSQTDPAVVAELSALLADYQGIVSRGDREGFARIYHPEATVSYPEGGQLVSVTCQAFAEEVAEMVEAGQVVEEHTRHLEILVGGDVAVLRVDFHLQLAHEHFEGTDFYSLARLNDSWRITQKIYDMAPV